MNQPCPPAPRTRAAPGATLPGAGSRPGRTVRFLVAAAVALGTAVASAPPAAAETPPGGPAGEPRPELVDPRLAAELAAVPTGAPVEFLVALEASPDLAALRFDRDAVVAALKATAEDSQRPVVDHLRAGGAQVVQTFWLANQVLVRAPAESVTTVTALPGVAAVLPVAELSTPEPELEPVGGVGPQTVEDRTWGVDRIGAHRVWEELGVDGTGVRVAVLDTGADITHPDLAGRMVTDDPADPLFPGGWMEWDADGNPVASAPHDEHFHGTHVSGTALGGDNFQDGTAIGVAPGASLMVGNALPGGSGTEPQILAAMQWAVDPYDIDGDPAGAPAQVVNMSFGATGAVRDSFAEAIRNMYFAGVLPVTSAGNSGEGSHGTPGNVFEAFAIGATDDADDVAAFSSGATVSASDYDQPPPEWPERWVVPDVSAPGVRVLSSVPPGTVATDPEAIYARASGTSMAAPHTAGAAALLLSADPSLTVDDLADLLIDPSFFDPRHGEQRPNPRFGHGRIDAFQSVARVVRDTGIAGELTDAATGEPVPAVDVTVVEAGLGMRTGRSGRYDLRLPPGTYTLELSWSGRVVTTVSDVVVAGDAVTEVDLALGGVAGQVTDAGTGDPVPDVTVEVAGTGVARTTGADGRYRLYLAPGTYPLELSWSGELVARAADVVVEPAAVTGRDLALGGVTGRVTDAASGDPLAGARVTVSGTGLAADTGADGGYRFYLAPGSYTLDFATFGYHETAASGVEVTESAFTTVGPRLEALPVGTVTGTVTLGTSGHAVPGITIEVSDTPLLTTTGADGGYTLSGVPIGSYGAVARSPLFPDSPAQELTVREGAAEVVDFTLDCGGACQLDEQWESRFDGTGEFGEHGIANANAIGVSPDGQLVFVTGNAVVGDSLVRSDFLTVAYDVTTGEQRWHVRYNDGGGRHSGNALGVSPDGSRIYVTGNSQPALSLQSAAATVAYDAASGEELWVARNHGPAGRESANSLAVSPDGTRVHITGQGINEDGSRDYATATYDAATGEELWTARYDGPSDGSDFVQDLGVSEDGSLVFVTGFSDDVEREWEYATVAYDAATGQERWTARFDGPASATDQPTALAVGGDGVYVTGLSDGTETGTDYATVAYDPVSGAQRWVSRYSGPVGGFDRPEAVTVSPDGTRVYVTGESTAEGIGFAPRDYATVAYDAADGAQLWDARVGLSPGRDAATGVAVSPDGSRVFVTGLTADRDSGSDYLTLAHDAADGHTIWAGQYDAVGEADFPRDLVVSPDGSRVLATGQSRLFPPSPIGQPGPFGVAYSTVSYDAQADEELPVFVPFDLRVAPDPAERGTPVRVRVAVANVGTVPGEYDAELRVDGELEDTTTVPVEPGGVAQVGWDLTRDEPGAYQVRVGHVSTTLAVVEPITCDRTVTGRHTGPLAVRQGVTCLAEGARVSGPVTVGDGAGLVATGATLVGPVTITGAEVVALRGSRVTGAVRVQGTTGQLLLSDNRVTGPVRLVGNLTGESPIVVSGNRVVGLLSCHGNVPPPTHNGEPNQVTGRTSGQCADLR